MMSKLSVRYAAVAQLDRVFGYEPKGRGFESLQPYQPWTTKSLYTLKASDFNVLTALGRKNPGAAYFCYFPKLAGLEPTQQRCPCRPIQNISTQFPRRSIDLRGRRNGVFCSHLSRQCQPPIPDSAHDRTIGPLEGMGASSPAAAFADIDELFRREVARIKPAAQCLGLGRPAIVGIAGFPAPILGGYDGSFSRQKLVWLQPAAPPKS